MARLPASLDVVRVLRAAGYSWAGLRAAARHHVPIRQELVLFAVLAPAGVWLGDTGLERAVLVSSLLLVLVVELINSAIETIVDRIGTEPHPLSGRAKDIGSAAVTLALLNVGVVWGFILLT